MTETVIVEAEEPSVSPAADEAARAAAAAAAASDAATAVAALAETQAAAVSADAAETIGSYEERLAECRTQLDRVIQSQEGLSSELQAQRVVTGEMLEELTQQVLSIQQRLAGPEQSLPAETPTEGEQTPPETSAEAEEPERPPERRRAHRWI